jgi:hypothetical protein
MCWEKKKKHVGIFILNVINDDNVNNSDDNDNDNDVTDKIYL